MKRLLILLLLLCTVTGLFACWTPQGTTSSSPTPEVSSDANTTNGSDGTTSTVLTPEILGPGEGPELPKVTLPGGTLSPTSPPEYTVPVEPPTTQPPTAIS